jgi:hypothetical protein
VGEVGNGWEYGVGWERGWIEDWGEERFEVKEKSEAEKLGSIEECQEVGVSDFFFFFFCSSSQ